MTIRLDHTIVPAKDKVASAKFFAEIFGLTVSPAGHFAPVQINESLTFDFADEPDHREAKGKSAAITMHFMSAKMSLTPFSTG